MNDLIYHRQKLQLIMLAFLFLSPTLRVPPLDRKAASRKNEPHRWALSV